MRKLIPIFLAVMLCFNMLVSVSAARESATYGLPTVSIDGLDFTIIAGYNETFTAKHIKVDKNNGNIYAFKDWTIEGVKIADTTSLQLKFVTPWNDIVLTPNYELLGDINKDERLNAHDLLALYKEVIVGGSEKAFDVNLDTKVNAKDSFALKCMLVGCYDVTELYYTVNVEGNDVTKYESPASVYGTLEVPFVAILEAYGAEVEWESDTVAVITYNEDRYTLNTEEYTMYLDGDDYNLLGSGAAGSMHTYTPGIKEIYIEHSVVMVKLNDIIKDRKIIDFDFENRVVNVIDNPNF